MVTLQIFAANPDGGILCITDRPQCRLNEAKYGGNLKWSQGVHYKCMKKEPLQNIRWESVNQGLSEEQVHAHPVKQFETWFNEALSSGVPEQNAMTLSTASKEGFPSARTVLLKGFDERGFVFYTNYSSRKGQDLLENPRAALTFFWPGLERQVRIEGTVEKTGREISETYFQSRPKGSQIAAAVSPQSQVISGRSVLEQKWNELEEQYKDTDRLPCPEYWGGFVVIPKRIEFWQGRNNRLHDRIVYSLNDSSEWRIERLAP